MEADSPLSFINFSLSYFYDCVGSQLIVRWHNMLVLMIGGLELETQGIKQNRSRGGEIEDRKY